MHPNIKASVAAEALREAASEMRARLLTGSTLGTTAYEWLNDRADLIDPQVQEGAEYYSISQIRAAFAKHATADDWNVPSFYESGLIKALRGHYDEDES